VFTAEYADDRILKICQRIEKLQARVGCPISYSRGTKWMTEKGRKSWLPRAACCASWYRPFEFYRTARVDVISAAAAAAVCYPCNLLCDASIQSVIHSMKRQTAYMYVVRSGSRQIPRPLPCVLSWR